MVDLSDVLISTIHCTQLPEILMHDDIDNSYSFNNISEFIYKTKKLGTSNFVLGGDYKYT